MFRGRSQVKKKFSAIAACFRISQNALAAEGVILQ